MTQKLFTNVCIHAATDKGGLLAEASVDVADAIRLKGIRIVKLSKGPVFVSWPGKRSQRESGESKYSDIFHTLGEENKALLKGMVLKAYEQFAKTSNTPNSTAAPAAS